MSLAINSSFWVQLRRSWDALAAFCLCGVEVDYLLAVALERKDDGIGWEDGKVGVELLRIMLDIQHENASNRTHVEELQLIDRAAYTVREQQYVSRQP